MTPPLLAPVALLACAPGGLTARAAFVQDVLVEDNRVWLTRDPDEVARKFESMAADRYDFMRGSVALHFADLARPHTDRTPTRFLRSASATSVLLVGDPHPENATLCHPEPGEDGPPSLEFVDLDAASFGPWTLDTRRAALGIEMLGRGLRGCEAGCRGRAVSALAQAYSERAMTPDTPAPPLGRIVDDLVDRARTRGAEGHRLAALAPAAGGDARRFLHTDDTRLEPLSPEEAAILRGAVAAWRMNAPVPASARVLDRARRFGSGVSSQPALRFAVLWDTGLAGPSDDRLLQIREVIDPPIPPGRALDQSALFDDNAQRVEYAAHTLWSRPDADPWARGLRSRGYDLKSVSWSDWLQPINHDTVSEAWAEGALTPHDLAELGATLGHVLAASHARGETASGDAAGPVIREDLAAGGGAPALRAELLVNATEDADRLTRDHAIFMDLLGSEGPLLGADALIAGAW